ncbi:DUF1648 domain-containing protein [Pseudarthrobacter sp. NPDC058329]|uniref:DUF1648 domain-containing protein n=1 Tax=Pseudarthrobacter sp. NPDC058329 TaxID=3346448 RepID=UPI0036D9FAB4
MDNPEAGPVRTWFLPSVLLVLATAVYGAILYPAMADPIPVHWDGSGSADRYAAKTVGAVFAQLMVALGIVVFLWLLHKFVPVRMLRHGETDHAQACREAAAGKKVLADFAPAVAVLFSWLSLRGWLGLAGPWTLWLPFALVVLFTVLLVIRVLSVALAPPSPTPPKMPPADRL